MIWEISMLVSINTETSSLPKSPSAVIFIPVSEIICQKIVQNFEEKSK